VNSPRHCVTHGWTAMARIDGAPWPASYPRDVTAYCPTHGWTHFTRDVAGPSGTAAPPSRTPSPMAVSPVRSPSPPGARGGRVASPTPPGFERQGTIAARRGAPPLDKATRHHFTLRLLHPLGSLRAATLRRRLTTVLASS
jgi:hypothetical protein